MTAAKALAAATLLAAACAAPAAAQTYQRQCNWVGGDYVCHSMIDGPRSTTYTTCGSNKYTGASGCNSYTDRKIPAEPPPYLVKKYQAEKAVAGKNR